MSELKYLTPKSLNDTLVVLSEYKNQACLIAGGTDSIAKKKRGVELPPGLINIQEVKELNYIKFGFNTGLSLGALVSLASIADSTMVKSRFPVLAGAAAMIGSPSIRFQATLGGNLCNASPSADTAPALIALSAGVKICSKEGERIVLVEDFFTGPGRTVLKTDEILTEIQVPPMLPYSSAVYLKQKRREGADLAVVGVAVFAVLDSPAGSQKNLKGRSWLGSSIRDVRIALGGVATTPLRARDAEEILKGRKLTDENLRETSREATRVCAPISDARSSAEYRLKMIEVLVPRAIKQAVEAIRQEVQSER